MFTLQKRDWQRYIPEAFGIRERFDAAREAAPDEAAKAAIKGDIELEIHGLTAEEARRLKNKVVSAMKVRRDGTVESPNAVKVEHELFTTNVRVTVPFQIEDPKTGTRIEITTPELIWTHAPPELVSEIKSAIEDYSSLEEGRRD